MYHPYIESATKLSDLEEVSPILEKLESLLANFGMSTYITCKSHPEHHKYIYNLKENLMLYDMT